MKPIREYQQVSTTEKTSDDPGSPFLHNDASFDDVSLKRRVHIRSWLRAHALSLLAVALLLYIAIVETMTLQKPLKTRLDRKRKEDRVSLIQDILTYEEKKEAWTAMEHPWNLPPSPELDSVWADVLAGLNIRIKPEEVEYLGLNTTNRIRANGGDYVGVIGIYHQLHCLNNLRVAIHWDDYYEPLYKDSPYVASFGKAHSDHCLDTIRQALMCHPTTEIHLAEWVKGGRLNGIELSRQAPSTCAVWESLDSWARPRALGDGTTYRPGPYEDSREKSGQGRPAR